jgi:hypothetical protein
MAADLRLRRGRDGKSGSVAAGNSSNDEDMGGDSYC